MAIKKEDENEKEATEQRLLAIDPEELKAKEDLTITMYRMASSAKSPANKSTIKVLEVGKVL
jgi:hypothetical protein